MDECQDLKLESLTTIKHCGLKSSREQETWSPTALQEISANRPGSLRQPVNRSTIAGKKVLGPKSTVGTQHKPDHDSFPKSPRGGGKSISHRHTEEAQQGITRDSIKRKPSLAKKIPLENKNAQIEIGPTTDCYAAHCTSLLSMCDQIIEDFSTWSSQLAEHLNMVKIAEASFGEVYRLSLRSEDEGVSHDDESVLKIIALTPPDATMPRTKRERDRRSKKIAFMSGPEAVASEVKLLQRMSSIPGFTNFRDVRVLKGRPAGPVIEAYKTFNRAQKAASKDISHFPNPALKTSYPEDQLWAVIEMQDAGTDLERLLDQGECTSVWHVWDVFWRTTLALAKGEESAEFEHRDLHLGNICVRGTQLHDRRLEDERKLGFTSSEVTLIDYTISRAQVHNQSGKAEVAHLDLATDRHLFEADASQEYQYEIYRYMRSALHFDDALTDYDNASAPSGRSWSQFHPQTNVVWLHYIADTLLSKMARPSLQPAPSRRSKAMYLEWKRANELEQILLSVQRMLDPAIIIKNGLDSAGSLVTLALSNDWLRPSDVVGEESVVDLTETLTKLMI